MRKIIVFLLLFNIFISNTYASYVVMNQDDNKVILSSGMHDKRLIASITKVMTAYIVIININNLDDYVTIGDEISNSHGSSIYLVKGEVLTVRDLLYGMMLRSGNDAATALAYYTGGSVDNFVKMMNDEVKKLNLKNTIFKNPTGLDDDGEGNISSAYDMAIITNIAMKNRVFREIFKTKHYKCKSNLKSFDWYNKNKTLVMYKNVTGGKTGYTKKAKRTLITTASKDNINLTIVTLNMVDDFNFHVNNYKNIFDKYQKYLILNKSNLNIDDSFYKNKGCQIYIKDNYFMLSHKSDIKNIRVEYILYKFNKVSNGLNIGSAYVYDNSNKVYDAPLYLSCKESNIYL